MSSSTDQLHNLSVQGPTSREILKQVVWTPPAQTSISELQWFRFTIGRIGDFNGVPVVVSRTGYTGELGYEVFCHPKDARDGVRRDRGGRQAARHRALRPRGAGHAADRGRAGLLRLRVCDQTDPFEAGIGFTVPLKTKTEDFVGREALLSRKEHPQRQLVGLDIATTKWRCMAMASSSAATRSAW